MTYPQIKRLFLQKNRKEFPNLDDKELQSLLNRAVPALRHLARPDLANFLDITEPEKLPIELIKKHVAVDFNYDAVDIGRIVSEMERYVEEHQAGATKD
jgi:hypothetical protein